VLLRDVRRRAEPNAHLAVCDAGKFGTERPHQLLTVKGRSYAGLDLSIVHSPLYFTGA
jgi:hypothetical protein